jgi:pumilio family protein 6
LSACRYGHFLIIKIVNFGNDAQRRGIIEEILSHCVKLSSHAEGAKVLDYIYANSTQLEQALILADFLKGQYALEHKLGTAPTPLATRLEKADPAERLAILTTIRTYLLKMAHKQMLMFRFVHSLAKQWLLFADNAMEDDLVTDLGAAALAMHDSREGADVVCHLIRFGSTKQRKVMVKLFKPRALEFWLHDHAHRIVVCALRTVDDTVLLAKNLITPMFETDEQGNACVHHDVCTSVGASKIFIGIISIGEGELKRYFKDADVANVLAIASGEHTKKDPAQRRLELLNVLLLPMLRTLVQRERWLTGRYTDEGVAVQVKGEGMDTSNLCGVLCDKSGGKIVLEGLRIAAELAGELKEGDAVTAAAADVYAALAGLCTADFKVLEHYQAHYVYKWLLTRLPADESTSFAQLLFEAVEPVLAETASSNRAAFVLLSLLETCSDAALVKQVAETLGTAYGEQLPKNARQGSKLLAAKVDELLTGKKSKSKTKAKGKNNNNNNNNSKSSSKSNGEKKTRRSKRK